MLLKIVMFDEMNPNWRDDRESNKLFLQLTVDFINEKLQHRGYVYLNQICEDLGVGWNPDDENPCIRNNSVNCTKYIQLETIYNKSNKSYEIHICSYN